MDLLLFAELALNGGLTGLMYSLVAIGVVLIYKSSSVPNLAQGALTMLGAYVVLAWTTALGLPIWAAGMSFGSWIAMTVGVEHPDVSLLLAVAPPVDRYDFAVVAASPKPKFIVHGEEDELIPAKEIRRFYASLAEPKELVMIEHANHLFEGKTTLVGDAVEGLLADWHGQP